MSPWEFVRYMEIVRKSSAASTVTEEYEFPDIPACAELRTSWKIRRRQQPVVPVLQGCPVPDSRPQDLERSFMRLMVYCKRWVCIEAYASEHVPYVTEMSTMDSNAWNPWETTCITWLNGQILTQEMSHVTRNMLCTFHSRQCASKELVAHSDDAMTDEALEASPELLAQAMITRIGGRECKKGEKATHHENSSAAMRAVQNIWPLSLQGKRKRLSQAQRGYWKDCQSWFSAVKVARQNRSKQVFKESPPTLQVCRRPSKTSIEAWLRQNTQSCNQEQCDVLHMVVAREEVEHSEFMGGKSIAAPTHHLCHGPPGTGKSEVLKLIKRLLVECYSYTQGKEFEITALQAVVACAHGGETLHHVSGINPFMTSQVDQNNGCQPDRSGRLSWLRWLFIDEAMMISAHFLGQVEQTLRWKMPDSAFFKRDGHGNVRMFGGLNIIHFGDTRQIPPPEGLPLFTIPSSLVPPAAGTNISPLADHGLGLMWGLADGGCQGVTDFTQHFRCIDPWWISVVILIMEN